MQLIPAKRLTPWNLAAPRPPSDFLKEALSRLRIFDLQTSEAAKLLRKD
jgi:hypothetical protein